MPDRRLAAILAADVVGYSRLIRADEEETLAELKRLRRDVIDPALVERGGRIVKLMGDGMLVEFPSAREAVRAAMEIQQAMADVPSPAGITFRVGINIGDVIVEDDDIFGDGVIVATRLEGEAEPGGICLSDIVHEQVRDRIEAPFADMGERTLKNIDRPITAWHWMPQTAAKTAADDPALPDRPSVAVLAFENFSSDPEHDFFGDGLAEEIITTLSKISSLFVIARTSTFTYKGRAVDVRTVGQELGVRYVVEGSVRASGQRIRVTAQLIDAADGRHVWAERYDRKLEDIFAIQDEITREIVTALRIRLSDGEQAQLWLRGTESVEAWSLMVRALELWQVGLPSTQREAYNLLERAVGIDPNYAAAYGLLGQISWANTHYGYADDPVREMERSRKAMDRALSLDPDLPIGHILMSIFCLKENDFDGARQSALRAIDLAPNNALIRSIACRSFIDTGLPEEAEIHIRYSMELDPFHPAWTVGILANALEVMGRDEEAIGVLAPRVEKSPDYFAGHLRLASLLGLAGRIDEARRHANQARRLNPKFGRESVRHFYSSPDPAKIARFVEGLEKAGMFR